jgi:hypothetical protein
VRRGRIVERGDHQALLAKGGEYAALWRRQTRANDPAAVKTAFTPRPPEIAGVR